MKKIIAVADTTSVAAKLKPEKFRFVLRIHTLDVSVVYYM